MNTFSAKFGIVISLFLFVLSFTSTSQDNCGLIYVSPTGSGLDGTIATPTSVLESMAINANDPSRNRVLLMEGVYNASSTIALTSGMTFEGGFSPIGDGSWTKNSNAASILNINPAVVIFENAAHHIGIDFSLTTNVVIKDLTINTLMNGSNDVFNGNGASIYGLYAQGSSNFSLERVQVNTGSAANGDSGANGSNGGNGSQGLQGQAGCNDCNFLGQGGSGGSGAFGGGQGGNGGYGDTNGGTGAFGAGPASGTGGGGGNGDGSTCAFGCSNGGTGGPASSGANGSSGSNGMNGSNGSLFNGFFIPQSGGNASPGIGGSGGGGGGGGGGSDCCLDDQGGGGGGGGGGGYPGLGGSGGSGGGASIGLLLWDNGAGGQLIDCLFNPGNAGAGGTGGNGGVGGSGSSGGSGGSGADNGGAGGSGGNGGFGGAGGTGGAGANGESFAQNVNGTAVLELDTAWPLAFQFTANYNRGCTNSQVGIFKDFGVWDLNAMQATFVNDLSPTSSSFDNTSNTAFVSFPGVGAKDIASDQESLSNFIYINDLRALPAMDAFPDTLCSEEELTLGTSETGLEYKWNIYNSSWALTQIYADQNPGDVNLINPGKYYVKFEVKDDCCGWSVPIFDSVVVREPYETLNLINICNGDSMFIAGAWQFDQGVFIDEVQTLSGCDSLSTTVLFIDACNEFGCTDPEADNYDPFAQNDDGSCEFFNFETICGTGTAWSEELQQCIVVCQADLNYDGIINTSDLLIFLSQFGLSCEDLAP
jgi:hypothetical protein